LVLFVAETGYFVGAIPQIRDGPDMGHKILLSSFGSYSIIILISVNWGFGRKRTQRKNGDFGKLYPVGIIVRPEQNELDGLIGCFPAIRAGHDRIITFFPTDFAIEVDDDEIALHGA
jgi:uncharacterized protein Veg